MLREKTFAARVASCRVPDCKRDPACRGLCRSHYQSAYTLVVMGASTWKQLEEKGKVAATTSAKQWFLS